MQKKLLRSSLIYMLLGFLAPAVNFFLLPIYTRYLDKADYALITLAVVIQAVFTPFLSLGMNGAFSRYFYDYLKDKNAIDRLFSTTMIFYLLVGIVLIGISSIAGPWAFNFFFSNKVFTFSKYGYAVLLTALAMNIQQIFLVYYRNYEAIGNYVRWSIFFFLTAAFFIYLGVVWFKMGADGSIKGRMIGVLFPLIPLYINFFKNRSFTFDWKMCKSMLPYALPLVPYLLLTVALANFDKFLVENNLPLSQLGEYGFATLIASVVEIIMNAVQSAIYPNLYRLLGSPESEEKEQQITNTFRITLLVNTFVIAALLSFTGLGLHLFINQRYWGIMSYFPLLCLVYIPRLIFTIWGIPLMYFKRTKFLPFVNGVALLLGTLLGTLLIKPFGIYSVPLVMFTVQLSQTALAFILNKKLKISLKSYRDLKKEYILLLSLFVGGLFSNYVYNTQINNVYVYLPVFFILLLIGSLMHFQKIRTVYAGTFRKNSDQKNQKADSFTC